MIGTDPLGLKKSAALAAPSLKAATRASFYGVTRRFDVNVLIERPSFVVGPDGESLTMDSLPDPATHRWTPRRKAQVVSAVHGSLLSADEACARYNISVDELSCWQIAVHRSGLLGLRVTRTQEYRARYVREQRFG
jgi:hypothetical protein